MQKRPVNLLVPIWLRNHHWLLFSKDMKEVTFAKDGPSLAKWTFRGQGSLSGLLLTSVT
jgi:hypothetical protein